MLSAIKRHLMQRGPSSLADIAMHLDSPPTAVSGMLEQWIRKGRVRRIRATPSCGTSCCRCEPAVTELYQWLESDNAGSREHAAAAPRDCSHAARSGKTKGPNFSA